jgi:hypothetical protein
MRLDIYGQFVVGVVRPNGGFSKGRPIAYIEEEDRCCPADLLIPNELNGRALEEFVAGRFSAFARPGCRVRRLDEGAQTRQP